MCKVVANHKQPKERGTMEYPVTSSFSEMLKTFRKHKHLTQKALAAALGVHRNTISVWERGDYLPESKTIVLELANQLKLDERETRQLLEASLTALSTYWYIPYQRNPFFTGRDSILLQLHNALHHECITDLSQSYALSGLGGIGKTQTAIEYAYRHVYDYIAILWVRAETKESLMTSFMTLAEVLHLSMPCDQSQDYIISSVQKWLNSHRKWLLIFDNVEDLEVVKPFLPTAHSGATLMTTRLQNVGIMAHTIELQQWTQEEGFQFLLSRARLQRSSLSASLPLREIQAIRSIVEIMDGLPLALDQVGAYIEATRCSPADYLQFLQSSQVYLLAERDTYADHPLSVTRTFTMAFEQIGRENASATALLATCAYLAPDAIPEAFFREGATYLGPHLQQLAEDPFAFNAAIKALLKYSLLQRNATTKTITIHRLVQTVLREYQPEATQRIWSTRVIGAMAHLFPSEETQANYWSDCEQLLSHALACLALSEQWDDGVVERITLMNHVAAYLSNSTRFSRAESLYQRALHLGKLSLEAEHLLIAETLHGLAILSRNQGNYAEAESLYRRALQIREHTLGVEHPLVAEILNSQASLFRRQGKYAETEQFYQRALRIRKQALGDEHPLVAATLLGLANLYFDQSKYTEAELLYKHVLCIWEQELGPEHTRVAASLNNLAETYREQGKYEQAEPLYQRALCIWEQTLGPSDPDVTYPLHGLAEIYTEQGKYEQAELLYRRALCIWEQAMETEHPQAAYALQGLAELYRKQGKYEPAELFYQRALILRQRFLGSQHPEVAESLHRLACFRQMQMQDTEALTLFQQALEIREQVLGSSHAKTMETRHAITCLLWKIEDMREVT
jgi:tetratricopeptide (TPR) repeat protein/transcriptional regulator with XRE-family HTH domain